MAPLQPWPWSTWGLCGSPSSSEKAWCLRWSATQEITGPSIAAEPRIASRPCSHVFALKLRWVRWRWKPTVIPSPVKQVHADEEEDVAPVQRLAPDLPGGEAERDEGDQRHQAGDDAVARLVGDRLDIGRERSRCCHRADHTRCGSPARRPGVDKAHGRCRSPAPRRCVARSKRASRSDPSRSSSGTERACRPRDGDGPTFYVRSPRAAAHALRAPGQLGLGRAYVSGEIEVDDMDAVIELLDGWQPPPLEGGDKRAPAAGRRAGRRAQPRRRAGPPPSCAPAASATARSATPRPCATTTTSPTSSSRSSSTTR